MRRKAVFLYAVLMVLVMAVSAVLPATDVQAGDIGYRHRFGAGNQRGCLRGAGALTREMLHMTVEHIEDGALREFMEQAIEGDRWIYFVSDISEFNPRQVECCYQVNARRQPEIVRHTFADYGRFCDEISRLYVQRCEVCRAFHDAWIMLGPGCGYDCPDLNRVHRRR